MMEELLDTFGKLTLEPAREEVREQVMRLSGQKEGTEPRPAAGAFPVFEGHVGAPAGRDEGREGMPQTTQGRVGHRVLWVLLRACQCVEAWRRLPVKKPNLTVCKPTFLLSDHGNRWICFF